MIRQFDTKAIEYFESTNKKADIKILKKKMDNENNLTDMCSLDDIYLTLNFFVVLTLNVPFHQFWHWYWY